MGFLSRERLDEFFEDILNYHELTERERRGVNKALHSIFKQAFKLWKQDGKPRGIREITTYFQLDERRYFYLDIDVIVERDDLFQEDSPMISYNVLAEVEKQEYLDNVHKLLH